MDKIPNPNFNSLLVSKKDGKIFYNSIRNYETRNESVLKLISLADQIYNFNSFDWVLINTDDKSLGSNYHGIRMLSFSSDDNKYDNVCPDFLFDSWPQVGIDDYEQTVKNVSLAGKKDPETDLLGWRGAITHPSRQNLLKLTNRAIYDVEEIRWNRQNPDKLTCENYVSLDEHVTKWKYLIDVEGNGWSARMKLFLFSRRVLFLQDRPYKEWFYKDLKPWVHYVPVNRDLSDLESNLNKVKTSKQLEIDITENAFEFAMNNLRRKNAIEVWAKLLGE